MNTQNNQNEQIVVRKSRFPRLFIDLGAENTNRSRSLKAQNNVLTLTKQLQKTFEKIQKMKFLTPKMSKN